MMMLCEELPRRSDIARPWPADGAFFPPERRRARCVQRLPLADRAGRRARRLRRATTSLPGLPLPAGRSIPVRGVRPAAIWRQRHRLHPSLPVMAIATGDYDGGWRFEGQLALWNWHTVSTASPFNRHPRSSESHFVRAAWPRSITARYFSSNPSDFGSLRTPCPPGKLETVASGPSWPYPAFAFVPV
jgi:hypothetical protein